MSVIKEVEKVIAELSPREALVLRFWLNEFKAARRYKKLKAYTQVVETLADFKKSSSNSSWN